MIKVYSWATPNGHKVHVMLEECGFRLGRDWADRLAIEYADESQLVELAEALAHRKDPILDSLRNQPTHTDSTTDALVERLVARLKIGHSRPCIQRTFQNRNR